MKSTNHTIPEHELDRDCVGWALGSMARPAVNLGGFTAFSTFGLDTFLLAKTHSGTYAIVNVAVHFYGGLLAVSIGYRLTS